MIADIHQQFGVRVSLLDFFQQPTVAALAELIAQQPQHSAPVLPQAELATTTSEQELANLSDDELDAMLAALSEQD